MVEKRVAYLINAEIDGEIGSEERAELAAILETSAEARKLRSELRRLADLMDRLPEQEPPAGLADRITQQIKLPSPRVLPDTRASNSWLSGLRASFRPSHTGLAFAAGLLMTVAYYEMSAPGDDSGDPSRMVGTMVAQLAESPVPEGNLLEIDAPGLSGTASVDEVSDFLVLRLNVTSDQSTEFHLGLAEAGLRFGGIARAAESDGYAVDERYEVSGGALRLVSTGSHSIVVFLRPAEPKRAGRQALVLEASQSGSKVFEGSLRLGSG